MSSSLAVDKQLRQPFLSGINIRECRLQSQKDESGQVRRDTDCFGAWFICSTYLIVEVFVGAAQRLPQIAISGSAGIPRRIWHSCWQKECQLRPTRIQVFGDFAIVKCHI